MVMALAKATSEVGTSRASIRLRSGPAKARRSNVLRYTSHVTVTSAPLPLSVIVQAHLAYDGLPSVLRVSYAKRWLLGSSSSTREMLPQLGVCGGCILTIHAAPSVSVAGCSTTFSIALFHSGSRLTSVMKSNTACGVASTRADARP